MERTCQTAAGLHTLFSHLLGNGAAISDVGASYVASSVFYAASDDFSKTMFGSSLTTVESG